VRWGGVLNSKFKFGAVAVVFDIWNWNIIVGPVSGQYQHAKIPKILAWACGHLDREGTTSGEEKFDAESQDANRLEQHACVFRKDFGHWV
jgi:hypothetical protein